MDKREVDQEIIELHKKYEVIFNNTHDAIFLIKVDENEDFYYQLLNSTYERLTGLTTEMVRGKKPIEILGDKLAKKVVANYRRCLRERKVISYEEELNLPRGNRIWATKLSPVIVDGQIVQIVGSSRDITEIREKEEKLKYLSFRDQLTGLHNRRFYEQKMKQFNVERRLPISLIIGDVNGLKLTNDVFGHKVGDELLQEIAKVLKASTRSEDIVARWGGDEYSIILPETDSDEAKDIVKRINNACQKSDFKAIPLSIALGWATKDKFSDDIEEVFKSAEISMYDNKAEENPIFENNLLEVFIEQLSESNYNTGRILEFITELAQRSNLSKDKKKELEE